MRLGQMTILRNMMLGLATGALVAMGTMAEAQRTVRNTTGPAETPPSSFQGSQYVDSEGCVFIRAGVGDTVRWVPRVNRDRTVVCTEVPRRPAATVTAAPTVQATEPVIRRQPAVAAPREIVEVAPRSAPTPRPASVRQAPAPRPARAAAPRPVQQSVSAPSRRSAIAVPAGCGASEISARYLRNTPACAAALRGQTASGAMQTATAAPIVRTTPATPRRTTRAVQGQAVVTVTPSAAAVRVNPNAPSPNRATGQGTVARGCAGASELSSRATRCSGGTSWSPPAQRQGGLAGVVSTLTAAVTSTRSAPRTVLVPAARSTFDVQAPPPGYRAAFRDGRLNPNRGPQTLQGDYQSQGVWTNETPRRLRPVIYVSE